MQIFDQFQTITLTNDQRIALEKLQAFLISNDQVFLLKGYAGSGKTTLVKGLVEYLKLIGKSYQIMAPTGRAAKIIHQKTGFEATTVHKGIYNFENLHEIIRSEKENDYTFLYQYKLRESVTNPTNLLIIDEASMISDVLSQGEFFRFGSGFLLEDIFTYGNINKTNYKNKVLFIGDPAQLPPIQMNFSPALDKDYLIEKFKVSVVETEMTEVKRQDATNGILKAATNLRKSLFSENFNEFDLRDNNHDIMNPSFQNFLEIYQSQKDKKIVICYKNKTALQLNNQIRKLKFGAETHIQPKDIIINGVNNYKLGILNGEFGLVTEVSPNVEKREVRFYKKGGDIAKVTLTWRKISLMLPTENNNTKIVTGYMLENYLYGKNLLSPDEQNALYIDFKNRNPNLKKGTPPFKEEMLKDEYFNCILLKFGYAITCHKAQGGEWPNAFVFWDIDPNNNLILNENKQIKRGKTNAQFYRWAYTAVTRASKLLFCINPPHFTLFSEMKFVDNEMQNAFQELLDEKKSTTKINSSEFESELEKFKLKEAPYSIQEHFIERTYLLNFHNINIENWEKVGYEIRYTFSKEGMTAAFKYWINGKNSFKPNFQKLPALTTSDQLFEEISSIIENRKPLNINISHSNYTEDKITEFKLEPEVENEKPHLKTLYEYLKENLSEDEKITNIQHFLYKERYYINKKGTSCTFDFEYDGKGFFGRVLPIENQCQNKELYIKIKKLINHVI